MAKSPFQPPTPPSRASAPTSSPDVTLTGQEPRTSRNQPTSEAPATDAPAPTPAPAPAKVSATPAADAPILPAYKDRGEGYATVTLKGLYDDAGGQYRVHAPIPQEIDNGGVTYDLHDRAACVYHQRVK